MEDRNVAHLLVLRPPGGRLMGPRLRVYLLRHGEPVRTDLFYGHHDLGLSERGRLQVSAQVQALASVNIERVYTSDLVRAKDGARAISEAHGLDAIEDTALREMHLGILEGVSHADAWRDHPSLIDKRYADMLDDRFEGGESVRDVSHRMLPTVEGWIASQLTVRDTGDLVIYTHNTVIRLLLAAAAGSVPDGYIRFEPGYGSISRIDFPKRASTAALWHECAIRFAHLDPCRLGAGGEA